MQAPTNFAINVCTPCKAPANANQHETVSTNCNTSPRHLNFQASIPEFTLHQEFVAHSPQRVLPTSPTSHQYERLQRAPRKLPNKDSCIAEEPILGRRLFFEAEDLDDVNLPLARIEDFPTIVQDATEQETAAQ